MKRIIFLMIIIFSFLLDQTEISAQEFKEGVTVKLKKDIDELRAKTEYIEAVFNEMIKSFSQNQGIDASQEAKIKELKRLYNEQRKKLEKLETESKAEQTKSTTADQPQKSEQNVVIEPFSTKNQDAIQAKEKVASRPRIIVRHELVEEIVKVIEESKEIAKEYKKNEELLRNKEFLEKIIKLSQKAKALQKEHKEWIEGKYILEIPEEGAIIQLDYSDEEKFGDLLDLLKDIEEIGEGAEEAKGALEESSANHIRVGTAFSVLNGVKLLSYSGFDAKPARRDIIYAPILRAEFDFLSFSNGSFVVGGGIGNASPAPTLSYQMVLGAKFHLSNFVYLLTSGEMDWTSWSEDFLRKENFFGLGIGVRGIHRSGLYMEFLIKTGIFSSYKPVIKEINGEKVEFKDQSKFYVLGFEVGLGWQF